MKPNITMRAALNDPQLLGNTIAGDSWLPWRTLLIASMGEELLPDERAVFHKFTGREREPGQRVEEFVAVKGRRGGGSRAVSVLAAYIAGLCQHSALVHGERGVLLIIAADQRQADVVLDYTEAVFRGSPVLQQLVEARTARELRLTNHIEVEVRAADYRRLRGLTFVAIIADEVAFWANENSSNPDDEILNAVRPGLATTSGPLFMISSPYARRGELWRIYQKHFGSTGDPLVLVAQGGSRDFNPTLPQSVVDRAMERDAAAASAEYGGNFRTDIEQLVTREAVEACVSAGVFERAPQPGVSYNAFVDPSGGSADSMALCIGHYSYQKQRVVIDCLRERLPPFSAQDAADEFARLLTSYGIHSIRGDRYAGIWPVEQFARFNIIYQQSAAPKSNLYQDLLALINSGRVELLDHQKLITQLCNLERRTARGGRDSIDHAFGVHDDIANAVAGLCAINNEFGGYDYSMRWIDGVGIDMNIYR